LDLEIFKITVYVHFLSDGWMDSKDVWYTDVSGRDECGPIFIGEVIVFGLRKLLENDSFCTFSQWFDGDKLYLVHRCIMKECRFF
jgi:hypothetical protein